MTEQVQSDQELVTLTIDGESVSVPAGTNLINAAKQLGIEIPFYCYHPHLSVPGNCRICQVEVVGAPKLMIGCHTPVREGMEVKTHRTSEQVKKTQAATMEMILINHPLDCTVCDQSGHCKLQDYHYEYNARPSRFLEEKEHKVKAEPLGPNVILDGERCIMCTRCIRFCDEITETSELGMLNRGDKSVISVSPGRPLDNPLAGSVVDLCPVGALTHRNWRFNSRIWYTEEVDSICPGCSTGCNVKVAGRDGQVVQVKARENADVNKEWLCDEGRYGFHRFLPAERLVEPLAKGEVVDWEKALVETKSFGSGKTLVLAAGDLTVEEYALLAQLAESFAGETTTAVCYKERELDSVQAKLVSPDYSANFQGAIFAGFISGDAGLGYSDAISKIKSGSFEDILVVGDHAFAAGDLVDLKQQIGSARSIAIVSDGSSELLDCSSLVLPCATILEHSGMLINRAERLQYSDRVIEAPHDVVPVWVVLNRIADARGNKLSSSSNDRELTLEFIAAEPRLAGLRIPQIKNKGVCLKSYKPAQGDEAGA